MTTGVALLVALGLLVMNAFFVAAEFALLAVRRSRVESLATIGSKRARLTMRALRRLALMLAGAQLGVTIASIGLGAVAEPALGSVFAGWFDAVGLPTGAAHGLAFVVALTIVVFLHMVVGELVPKSLTLTHPEPVTFWLIGPFLIWSTALKPVLWLMNATANALVRLLGVEPQEEIALTHSAEELSLVLRSKEAEESIEEGRVILVRSLELSGLDALEAMTHRRDVVGVPATANLPTLEKVMHQSGRSRVIVYQDNLDSPQGVVHFRDVLLATEEQRATMTAADICSPLLVVDEDEALEDLLVTMRETRRHIAGVESDAGKLAGVVSLEDVVEELIGEFDDETDRVSRRLRKLRDGSWLANGIVRPDELDELVGVRLPEDGPDTIGEFIEHTLQRPVTSGDEIELQGWRIRVLRTDDFGVREVRLVPILTSARRSLRRRKVKR